MDLTHFEGCELDMKDHHKKSTTQVCVTLSALSKSESMVLTKYTKPGIYGFFALIDGVCYMLMPIFQSEDASELGNPESTPAHQEIF